MKPALIAAAWALGATGLAFSTHAAEPVTPNATPEARQLLKRLYQWSGQYVLAGQHDYPLSDDFFARYTREGTGEFPALVGRDFGFSARDTLDGVNFRQRTVDSLIASHRDGAIVTLMWHAVPPTMREPVEFRSGIQSDLTDKQWEELITPGTAIHERWMSQVDVIASYLRQLQEAQVPVIWRPYHEMNGGWFWWGDKPGPDGYARLYRMLFDRLVNFHDLRNLIWVFNGNQIRGKVKPYEDFFPGHDVVDVLATDVYGEYAEVDYRSLLALAGGKPIALGEVGPLPTPEYFEGHPRWVWYMVWSERLLVQNERDSWRQLHHHPRVLTLSDLTQSK